MQLIEPAFREERNLFSQGCPGNSSVQEAISAETNELRIGEGNPTIAQHQRVVILPLDEV